MKPIFASKTVWLNIVTLAIGVISLAQGMNEFMQFAPYLVFASGVLNLVLRIYFTTDPIV